MNPIINFFFNCFVNPLLAVLLILQNLINIQLIRLLLGFLTIFRSDLHFVLAFALRLCFV